jgi:class 3 adenylate cyclase
MRWKARGHSIQLMNPQDVERGQPAIMHEVPASEIPLLHPPEPAPIGNAAGVVPMVCAMMFADVKHFSRLGETQIPGFLRDFIGPVTSVARQFKPAPLFQNTWGDGLFFVFATAGDAAQFSLSLRDRVAAIDREALGLPNDMRLRIALHAGPVFRFQDQMIGKPNYMGSHVNYAARIEPVTPEGRIYATETFAALAALDSPGRFRFDYVGKVPLYKDFGRFPLYELNRD